MIENNNDLAELISNSQVAFLNGRYQEAFSLARSAIKLDPKCADAYQCAAVFYKIIPYRFSCSNAIQMLYFPF